MILGKSSTRRTAKGQSWGNPLHFSPCLLFIPFPGCRACLGEQLAQTELFVFFTCLLREFAFRLPDEVKEVNMEPVTSTVAHPHPYKLCAEASKVQHSHEQGKECD